MNEIKCPKCGTMFTIDEQDYDSILKQIRDQEFERQIKEREILFKNEKENAVKLKEAELEKEHQNALSKKEEEILRIKSEFESSNKNKELEINSIKTEIEQKYKEEISNLNIKISGLENDIKLKDTEKETEVLKLTNKKDQEIQDLQKQIEIKDKEYELEKKTEKEKYELELSQKDKDLAYYKEYKARQSTKMIGENLEQHCNAEFEKIRSMFSRKTYFEKDNDASGGSKGDFIFRDFDDQGNEIVSIMFEMKNEADDTEKKHKNEDFFKKLDKDRRDKNCEYAVLVSLLEIDSEVYNAGIVDVSHKFEKMYVIRPQFFVPIITLLRNASLKSLTYKKQLNQIKNQNIDISDFEEKLNIFKEGFNKNYLSANKSFDKAIDEIDNAIKRLNNVKDALESCGKQFRYANDKLDDITIKKLVKNNKTMAELFAKANNDPKLQEYADSIKEAKIIGELNEETQTIEEPNFDNAEDEIMSLDDTEDLQDDSNGEGLFDNII